MIKVYFGVYLIMFLCRFYFCNECCKGTRYIQLLTNKGEHCLSNCTIDDKCIKQIIFSDLKSMQITFKNSQFSMIGLSELFKNSEINLIKFYDCEFTDIEYFLESKSVSKLIHSISTKNTEFKGILKINELVFAKQNIQINELLFINCVLGYKTQSSLIDSRSTFKSLSHLLWSSKCTHIDKLETSSLTVKEVVENTFEVNACTPLPYHNCSLQYISKDNISASMNDFCNNITACTCRYLSAISNLEEHINLDLMKTCFGTPKLSSLLTNYQSKNSFNACNKLLNPKVEKLSDSKSKNENTKQNPLRWLAFLVILPIVLIPLLIFVICKRLAKKKATTR